MESEQSVEKAITVKTKHGPVRGCVQRANEQTYYNFKSIPYAKPPVGNLRFLPPVPIQPWIKEMDCTKPPPEPVSFNYHEDIVGSEDCLYLQVSSPNIQPSKLLPVMFWIAGFSFSWYGDSIFDSSLIVDEGVVFVKCGYRLGPLGFLSLKNVMAPGNVGLKDLVLAMRWVQTNIEAFGGDRDNVTIFGGSSGAIIVHLMMVSPMATGLFHKAIIQSGTALNNWSMDKNAPQTALELAKQLGINEKDPIKLIEQLKLIPAHDIFKAMFEIYSKMIRTDVHLRNFLGAIFRPCIEVEFEGQSTFLSRSPLTILKSGKFNKVPLIIGSVNDEGSLIECCKADFYNCEKFNENVGMVVPESLCFNKDPITVECVGRELLDFYLGRDKCLTKDTKKEFVQLISDYYFLYFVNKTVRMQIALAPECAVYYYVINCAGSWELYDSMGWFNTLGHSVELPFLFRMTLQGGQIVQGSKDSVRTRSRVVKMWTNFAKFGNPTPHDEDRLLRITWEPVVNANKLNYLSIGHDLTKGRNPFLERMKFWDYLFTKYAFLRACVYFADIGIQSM